MNTNRIVLALALVAALSAGPAFAGGSHHGGGHYHGYYGPRVTVGLGLGFGWPYYGYGYGYPYYAPYAYYPPYYAPAYAPQQPSTYVEQPAQQAQPQQPSGFWYYCNDSGAYYPYVKECASAWQRVAPQPQN